MARTSSLNGGRDQESCSGRHSSQNQGTGAARSECDDPVLVNGKRRPKECTKAIDESGATGREAFR